MVRTTKRMISTIYVVVKMNKYYIKVSQTKDVVAVGVAIIIGDGRGGRCHGRHHRGDVVPPSSTVGTLVAFEGTCVGAFADGARPLGNNNNIESTAGEGGNGGSLAPWSTRTVASPSDSFVTGDAIPVAIVVVVVIVSRCHRPWQSNYR